MKIDPDFAEDIISKALKRGADQAEVFIRSSRTLSVEIKKQTLDSFTSSSGFGYSLRIIKKGRPGFSYSTDMNDREFVVENAVGAANYSDEDICIDLPEASGMAQVEVFDPVLDGIKEEDSVAMVMLLERSAYEEDKRIRKVRKATGTFTSSETAVINSRSVKAGYSSTSCSAWIVAIAGQGDESRMGVDFDGGRFLGDVSFEETGRNAARRATCLLGARKIESSKADIILDNLLTVDFLGIFASSLSAEAVQKGRSLLKNRLNKRVISSKINILDTGLLPGKMGSRPVDDEGVAVKEKTLISEGVLRAYLYNTCTAKKGSAVSTGNAVRGGFSSLPSVGITNLFLEAARGSDIVPKNKMFSLIKRGLYIVNAMGVHSANPISGEFSIGVTGLWIENGEVKFPVKEAVISGTILEFFDRVEAIGDDFRFYGNIGAPSLVISGMDISA
ncbi:MAG: TldD/PmbA family protein [Nitrospirota bacterium]|nr:TldD/PmbA family protein [Nitrospirota bacterium]